MAYGEVVPARSSDFRVRPNFKTERVEFTYLPTGLTVALTPEECDEFVAQLREGADRKRGEIRLNAAALSAAARVRKVGSRQ